MKPFIIPPRKEVPQDVLRSSFQRISAALVQPLDLVVCPDVNWACRFLTVANRPLVAKVWDDKTFVALRSGGNADDTRMAAIQGADLRGRMLRFAVLTGSELFGADLTGAQLQRAQLAKAQMQYAILEKAGLQDADLFAARLQGANLHEARLQGANPYKAYLQRAHLFLAQLQGADLEEASLQGAELVGAHLEGAAMDGAYFWNVKTDGRTEIGLTSVENASSAAADLEDLQKALPKAKPDLEEKQLRAAVNAALPDAEAPFKNAITQRGKVLIDDGCQEGYVYGIPCKRTRTNQIEHLREVIPLWVEEVARLHPAAAETIASYVPIDLNFDDTKRSSYLALACRLLAETRAGSVQLKPYTINRLKDFAGVGCQPPAQAK